MLASGKKLVILVVESVQGLQLNLLGAESHQKRGVSEYYFFGLQPGPPLRGAVRNSGRATPLDLLTERHAR